VECKASDSVLAARLRERETQPSISDARLHHLEEFKKKFQPYAPSEGGIHMVADTATPLPVSVQRIMLTYIVDGTFQNDSGDLIKTDGP
jgi:predicted kinase